MMSCTASCGKTCSQMRSTLHPSASAMAVVSASRSTFLASFGSQYSTCEAGIVPCSGHPCQKQPSMNTARRRRVQLH